MKKYVLKRVTWFFVFTLFLFFSFLHADAAPGDFLAKWQDGYSFNTPSGVAVDAEGNVYVADMFNNRILKFTSEGIQINSFNTGTVTFSSPFGIAVDDTSGDVYVADAFNNRILKFTNTGYFVTEWGSPGTGDREFDLPFGVAAYGNVYVADQYNNRIQKFTDAGLYVTQWGSYPQFNLPWGIAVGADESVYVADTSNGMIQVFDSTGSPIGGWEITGFGGENFGAPVGIAVDDNNGLVYVTDIGSSTVRVYQRSGSFWTEKTTWGGLGTGDGQFNIPLGIALDQCGSKVYVTDSYNDRIQILEGFGGGGGSSPLTIGEITKTDVSCYGGNDGSISVTASGGNPPYTYSNDGGINYQTSNVFSGLIASTYKVVVKDQCSNKGEDVTISQPETPLTIACPASILSPTDPDQCSAIVNYTVTAKNYCSSVQIVSNPSSVSFPKGTTTVTSTATDGAGNTANCTFTVTVEDREKPKITAPPAVTAYTGPGATSCGATVSDAALGAAITNDNCPGVSVTRSGVPGGNLFPVGSTIITYTAKDMAGNIGTATQTVTVVDNTLPTITNASASPSVLWPPNHKMVPVAVAVSALDNCDLNPACRIISVSSNEPENGLGDGDTAPDWGITGSLTVNLRAERSGTGSGRVYTITVQCTDASGNNSTTKSVAVTVPHDQGKK
jgi:DNA-binding beta-propeller fold protein YncE